MISAIVLLITSNTLALSQTDNCPYVKLKVTQESARDAFDKIKDRVCHLELETNLQELKENMLKIMRTLAETDMPHLKKLDLSSCHYLRNNALRGLSAAKFRLEEFNIDDQRIGLEGMRTLANSPVFSGLKTLFLGHNELTQEAIAEFTKKTWPNLESLDFQNNFEFKDESAFLFAKSDKFPNLKILNLRRSRMTDEGAISVANGHFPKLEELLLSQNAITYIGAEKIANAAFAKQLKILNLESVSTLGDAGVTAIANGQLTNLEYLGLSNTGVKADGLKSLAISMEMGSLSHLESLDLSYHTFTRDDMTVLGQGYYPQLKDLSLYSCQLEPEALAQLLSGRINEHIKRLNLNNNKLGSRLYYLNQKPFPKLEELYLEYNGIDTTAVKYNFLLTTHFPKLRILNLSRNPIDHAAFMALSNRDSLPSLQELYAGDNTIQILPRASL